VGSTVFYEGAAELATLTNTFSVSGTPTDPTTVSLAVTDPDGVTTTYTWAGGTVTRTGTGAFTKDIACATAGTWTYVWTGTGTASDVQPGSWTVASADFSDLYCTPEMLKDRVGISDDLDNSQLPGACRAVSRWIDTKFCQRHFYRRTATLTFAPTARGCLEVPDLVSVTSLKTDTDGDGVFETTWSTTDYQLLPVNAAVEAEPAPYTDVKAIGSYTFPVACTGRTNRVQIEGVWGWPAVPESVIEAAKILAGDYLALGGMKFGVAGYGEYGAVRARMSNPALEMLLAYVHPRAAILMG
jgi:hypothetical protein